MNFLNNSISRAQGRVLAFTIMHQIRPQLPSPPPQASEADSCFMGRPFTHSRPGSLPRDTQASACLSHRLGTASVSPIHFLPHPRSEAAWASSLLTKASGLTRRPAKHSLPCAHSAPGGGTRSAAVTFEIFASIFGLVI